VQNSVFFATTARSSSRILPVSSSCSGHAYFVQVSPPTLCRSVLPRGILGACQFRARKHPGVPSSRLLLRPHLLRAGQASYFVQVSSPPQWVVCHFWLYCFVRAQRDTFQAAHHTTTTTTTSFVVLLCTVLILFWYCCDTVAVVQRMYEVLNLQPYAFHATRHV